MSDVIRKIRLAEFFKNCTHVNIEEIRNGYEKVIGGQCSTCLEVIWGAGKCDGCGEVGQLRSIVSGRRYHGEECLKLARKKAVAK